MLHFPRNIRTNIGLDSPVDWLNQNGHFDSDPKRYWSPASSVRTGSVIRVVGETTDPPFGGAVIEVR